MGQFSFQQIVRGCERLRRPEILQTRISSVATPTQGAAKGGRQKEFDHFLFFGHILIVILTFSSFFRHYFAKLLLAGSFCGKVTYRVLL